MATSLRNRAGLSGLALLLLASLVAVNLLSVLSILSIRERAREGTLRELRLAAEGAARAVEEGLGELRRQTVALTRSPVLLRAVGAAPPAGSGSPALGTAAVLREFVEERPAVRAVALRDRQGAPLALLARREEGVALLPLTSDPPAPIAAPGLAVVQLPVGGRPEARGLLEVWLDAEVVAEDAAPGLGGRLLTAAAGPPEGPAVQAAVRDPQWVPPIAWTLVLDEASSDALTSLSDISRRSQWTVALNVGVMSLTLVVGLLALRAARRTAALEAEARHRERTRELERQVQHADRLASVGRLAAGVAHEINNPLEGISNYLSLLEEDLGDGRVDDARTLVGRVREGLERVASVTRRMLTFSAPRRTPGGALELGPLDLRGPLAEAVGFVRGHRAFRGVAIAADPPGAPVPVRGDPVALGQLFLNLLLNACQAMDGRGSVRVTTEAVGGRARVVFEDAGPGFSDEALRHLFEPFFSTRSSTGLGLAVCRGIAAEHGGELSVANRERGGARVTVELPLAERAEGAVGDDGTAGVERGRVAGPARAAAAEPAPAKTRGMRAAGAA